MSGFAVQNYQQGIQRLLAACDEDLLGQKFTEDGVQLDVTPGFFDGMRVEEEALQQFMRSCTMANLVGPRTVKIAVDLGVIEEDSVRTIEGVPHAQLIVILP